MLTLLCCAHAMRSDWTARQHFEYWFTLCSMLAMVGLIIVLFRYKNSLQLEFEKEQAEKRKKAEAKSK